MNWTLCAESVGCWFCIILASSSYWNKYPGVTEILLSWVRPHLEIVYVYQRFEELIWKFKKNSQSNLKALKHVWRWLSISFELSADWVSKTQTITELCNRDERVELRDVKGTLLNWMYVSFSEEVQVNVWIQSRKLPCNMVTTLNSNWIFPYLIWLINRFWLFTRTELCLGS